MVVLDEIRIRDLRAKFRFAGSSKTVVLERDGSRIRLTLEELEEVLGEAKRRAKCPECGTEVAR